MATIAARSLWRQPDFLRLWAADSVSSLGSSVSAVALPLVAILTLNASATQMGLLPAVLMATTCVWAAVSPLRTVRISG